MIRTIKTSFNILKNNLIIIQPLLIFMIIFGILAQPLSLSGGNIMQMAINGILLYLIVTTFISGWFYMIKLVVRDRNKEYNTPEEVGIAQIELLKSFFVGVGEYIVPMILNVFLYVLLFAAFSFLVYKVGVHFIGHIDMPKEMVKALSGTEKDVYNFLLSPAFTADLKNQLKEWVIFLLCSNFVLAAITMFMGAIAFFKTQNPLKILVENVKFIFRNFIETIIITTLLLSLNLTVFVINITTSTNVILSVISIFVTIMYLSYYVIIAFLYYDEKNENNIDYRA